MDDGTQGFTVLLTLSCVFKLQNVLKTLYFTLSTQSLQRTDHTESAKKEL